MRALVDIPAVFVGLAAVEAGGLDARDAVGQAGGGDIIGDVRGILLMMAERGQRIFRCRWRGADTLSGPMAGSPTGAK